MMVDRGSSAMATKLSDGLVRSFAIGKVYKDHQGPINGLDFTYDGLHLITSGEDSGINVYSTIQAQKVLQLRAEEKHGVSLIKFLQNDKDCAVAASRRGSADHVLKCWDLKEDKYVRELRGHSSAPSSVSPHAYEDFVLSAARDGVVMLWDLRQERPTAKITGTGGISVASFDQQGMVFAAGVWQPKIHLFDTRKYQEGAFAAFDLRSYVDEGMAVYSVQFSPCGKYVLARTSQQLLLLDAFDGELICEYPVMGGDESMGVGPAERHGGYEGEVPMASFSPDSQFVMSGMPSGEVCVWAATNARLVHRLQGHSAAPAFAAFSPAHACAVTAAADGVAWWIPDPAPL